MLRQLSSTSYFSIDAPSIEFHKLFSINATGFLRQLSSTSNFTIDATGFLRQLSSTRYFTIDTTGFLRQLSSTSNFSIDATGFLRQLSSTIILVDWLTTFRSINILLMDWHSSGLLLLTFGGLALLWASPVICFHCSPVFTMASE